MKCRVEVSTRITDDEGQEDCIRTSAVGEYTFSPEKQVIDYADESDGGCVSTRVEVSDGTVSIVRDSPYMPSLELSVGLKTDRSIHTPYGSIDLSCRTERVLARLDEKGGYVFLRYGVSLGGAESCNHVRISVKEI